MKLAKLMLFATPMMMFAAGADYRLTLHEKSIVAGTELAPGDYKLQVDGDKVKFQKVTVGRDLGTDLEVTGGLSDGQRVIANPGLEVGRERRARSDVDVDSRPGVYVMDHGTPHTNRRCGGSDPRDADVGGRGKADGVRPRRGR